MKQKDLRKDTEKKGLKQHETVLNVIKALITFDWPDIWSIPKKEK